MSRAPRAPEAEWTLEVGGGEVPVRRFPLGPGEWSVGAGADCQVRLCDAGVSRRHARVEVLPDGGAVVSDLGSKNGTFVGGRRVRRAAVGEGARLTFGPVEAVLRPVDRRVEGIAIPPAGSGAAASERPAATDPSTRGVAPVERAVSALRNALLGAGPASDPGLLAVALVEAWRADLPLAAIAILRRAGSRLVVVAHAGPHPVGSEVLGEPGLRVDHGFSVHAWPAEPGRAGRTLERLRPCFELAAAWLAERETGRPAAEPPPSAPSEPIAGTESPGPPATADPRLARVWRQAERGARGTIPVLVLGESGVGKEVMARFVHRGSPRSAGPFLAINCAALSADLLEAELFGIERGVATGVDARPGLLERASGGTLFLDELGDMPLPLQAKLLRVLEGSSFYRVGGRDAIEADVRFVAATHADLGRKVEDGSFRADLYHRLAAFQVEIPPLRDRPEDVPLLAARFFHGALGERGVASPGITRAALGALVRHRWPGNVRELKNEIARAVLMLEPGEPLDLHHLSGRLRGPTCEAPPLSLAEALAEAERRAFRTALSAASGDAGRAMELLDLPRSTYYRKIKELGVG